jgi:phosphopantothenoylcysteine synthetase/decarboxylase
MAELANKRIVLGLTGGIACYKVAEFLRRAQDEGATMDVVMTDAAAQFITPVTMQALSGRPVFQNTWDNRVPQAQTSSPVWRMGWPTTCSRPCASPRAPAPCWSRRP